MALRRDRRDERGVSTAETVIVFPIVATLIWVIFQVGVAIHANAVAEAAAQEGAAAARRYDGSQEAGRDRTLSYLQELGPTIIENRDVEVTRTAETATVTVRGTVISLIPGIHLTVEKTASGPVERYVPPSGEFTP